MDDAVDGPHTGGAMGKSVGIRARAVAAILALVCVLRSRVYAEWDRRRARSIARLPPSGSSGCAPSWTTPTKRIRPAATSRYWAVVVTREGLGAPWHVRAAIGAGNG